MEHNHNLSNLLVTYEGTLILLTDSDLEIVGIEEQNNDLQFKLKE